MSQSFAAFTYDLRVPADYDFTADFTVWIPPGVTGAGNPMDFTGATAELMFRVNPGDVAPILSVSTTPSASGSVSLTSGSVGPPITPSVVTFALARVATALIVAMRASYQLRIIWGDGMQTPLMDGGVFVKPAITYP